MLTLREAGGRVHRNFLYCFCNFSVKWSEVKSLSHVWLYATPWTVACQAPLSMGFSRQKYWSGLLCHLPGDLPNPGIGPSLFPLLHWQAGSLPLAPPGKPSDLWGMSIYLATQAAPSWVDLGDVFNVASRISKPFTERIYSSCCSQASFNFKLEFYLFPWSCQLSYDWEGSVYWSEPQMV